jgi:hypothetical protein
MILGMCVSAHMDKSFGTIAEARFENRHKGFILKGPKPAKIILRVLCDSVVKKNFVYVVTIFALFVRNILLVCFVYFVVNKNPINSRPT